MSHPRTLEGAVSSTLGFSAAQRGELARLTLARAGDDAAGRRLCLSAGIGMRHIARAANRRPLQADQHLALCAGLGVDPVSLVRLDLLARPPRAIAGPIAWWHVALGLKLKREVDHLTVRAAADRVDLSPATFVRLEEGTKPRSVDSLFRACALLQLHPHDVTAPLRVDPEPAGASDIAAAREAAGALFHAKHVVKHADPKGFS